MRTDEIPRDSDSGGYEVILEEVGAWRVRIMVLHRPAKAATRKRLVGSTPALSAKSRRRAVEACRVQGSCEGRTPSSRRTARL